MNLSRLGVFALFLFAPLCPIQDKPKVKAPSPARKMGEGAVAEIPIRFEQERIIVPVKVKDSRELNMILDTGHPGSGINILHPDLGRELDLDFVQDSISGGAGRGGGVPSKIARGEKVYLSDVELFADRIVVMMKRRENFPVQDGIISGRTIFDSYTAEIDFENSMLLLYEPSTFVADDDWKSIPLVLQDGFPVIKVKIDLGGKREIPVKLLLDLGGRGALVLTPNRSRRILPPKGAKREKLFSGASGDVYGKRGRANAMTMADFLLKDFAVLFTDHMNLSEFDIDGVLGIRLIRKFNVIFDLPRSRLWLKPNKSFYDPL